MLPLLPLQATDPLRMTTISVSKVQKLLQTVRYEDEGDAFAAAALDIVAKLRSFATSKRRSRLIENDQFHSRMTHGTGDLNNLLLRE